MQRPFDKQAMARTQFSRIHRNQGGSDSFARGAEMIIMRKMSQIGLASWLGVMAIAWSAASFAGRPADCAAEADRASRGSGSVMGGVGRGAATGALFGAIVGNRKGAGRGAALGAVVGGVRQGSYNNNVYQSVYDACMRRY